MGEAAIFDFLLRFAPVSIGIVFVFMSWGSWTFGEPPPWSLFGPRSTETVIESQVVEGRAGNGTIRFTPVVTVTTPLGPQQLQGLIPSFSSFSRDMASGAIAGYPVGGQVQVRWVGAVPMADRVDLFGMAHAVFLSLFAGLLLFGGLFWAWAMGAGKRKSVPG